MENSTIMLSPEIQRKRESCWPEILKRLPVSQLGVCLCVSKKGYSLLTSPAFITSQIKFLSQTNFQSSNLFLLRSFLKENPEKPTKEFYHICSEPDETLETLTKKTFQHPFKTKFGVQFRLVGSVNGVIFLCDDYICNSCEFILWNPAVNCFIQLPKPLAFFYDTGPCMIASGFGYDAVNDDFKVVRVEYQLLQPFDAWIWMHKTQPRAEVYSVKEGRWRWIRADNVEYCTMDSVSSQCFLRGNVHWVAYERLGEENLWSYKSTLLLLFNVEKEKFLTMKLPLEVREVCPLNLIVSECQGMLCVNHYVQNGSLVSGSVHYNLWVKKEYNKSASWVKVASIDLQGCGLNKIAYWGENRKLLGSTKDNELVSYDPETNNVEVLGPGCPDLDDLFAYPTAYEACSFVETLAFLNKNCKNRRSFLPGVGEGEAESNNVEELTPSELQIKTMGEFFVYMMQLEMFRKHF